MASHVLVPEFHACAVHVSFVSSHTKRTLSSVPRSISIPPSWLAVPVSSLLSRIILSPISTWFELTVVVVP